MSVIFNYAYTTAFPKDSKITWAQAFEGLRYKAAAPMTFVPAIAAAEVLEQNSGYIKRDTTLKTGDKFLEDIHLYAPSLVCRPVYARNRWLLLNNNTYIGYIQGQYRTTCHKPDLRKRSRGASSDLCFPHTYSRRRTW
jgi:hypothetical protein